MAVDLTALHWIYLLFIGLIIGFMLFRRDTSLVCIIGIFLLGLVATHSVSSATIGIFNSFIYAIKELLGTILVISIIVAMSHILTITGINDVMIRPFAKLIRNPFLGFWVIGILMMTISWFFWPSPAVALMGAVLLPVAARVGLPAIGVAVAMNLFGHGIALSSDFVIQGAPKLTSEAAGIPVSDVLSASVPLVFTMGIITTIAAYLFLRRDMKKGTIDAPLDIVPEQEEKKEAPTLSTGQKKFFALMIPILFAADLVAMTLINLQGGDATALIGGTSIVILIIIALFTYKNKGLEETTSYFIDGFQFGFKIFGPVIPIAAFFYLGDSGFKEILGDFLPEHSLGIVNDLGVALASVVPLNAEIGSVTLTAVGAITGLDGSGFSGISLAGSIAHLFAASIGHGIATLTALGQIAAIWVGGGTLVPWALIPAAAICGVSPFELARRNLIPVIIGLVATTILAMFLI
ncbi:membrane protein [Fictibacillus gelatini]|uniref:membrane protein n=1 Tax=Fictibacillus gelatini TaxID=225985 RepID=UPI000424C8D9|nr:membrane protein [Fictibacillus gelatini]